MCRRTSTVKVLPLLVAVIQLFGVETDQVSALYNLTVAFLVPYAAVKYRAVGATVKRGTVTYLGDRQADRLCQWYIALSGRQHYITSTTFGGTCMYD